MYVIALELYVSRMTYSSLRVDLALDALARRLSAREDREDAEHPLPRIGFEADDVRWHVKPEAYRVALNNLDAPVGGAPGFSKAQ